jgi:hypothetical protein
LILFGIGAGVLICAKLSSSNLPVWMCSRPTGRFGISPGWDDGCHATFYSTHLARTLLLQLTEAKREAQAERLATVPRLRGLSGDVGYDQLQKFANGSVCSTANCNPRMGFWGKLDYRRGTRCPPNLKGVVHQRLICPEGLKREG